MFKLFHIFTYYLRKQHVIMLILLLTKCFSIRRRIFFDKMFVKIELLLNKLFCVSVLLFYKKKKTFGRIYLKKHTSFVLTI